MRNRAGKRLRNPKLYKGYAQGKPTVHLQQDARDAIYEYAKGMQNSLIPAVSVGMKMTPMSTWEDFWENVEMELDGMFRCPIRMDSWLFVLGVVGNRSSLTLAQLNLLNSLWPTNAFSLTGLKTSHPQ